MYETSNESQKLLRITFYHCWFIISVYFWIYSMAASHFLKKFQTNREIKKKGWKSDEWNFIRFEA